MENTEEDTLLVEGSGEPEYNTYQLVWIQPDGTGVRQTVFEKSYAGAPSVYASYRAGNKILQDGSTGPSHSYLDASSVDNVQESYPGDDDNTTQRHHLKRQHSETCTSCGALYRDTSVSIDSESDVSDSESTHGRSMIVRQFSTDSMTDAMTAVEPSPLNRRNFSSYSREQFYGGNAFSKSASEQWTLEHKPHIANTKETRIPGSGALTNRQGIHTVPIPVQQSDKEAWTRAVVTKGPPEVTLSMDQEIDSRVRSENVCMPHGASVVKEATAVDNDGLPGQTRVSEYRRIDGPRQVTVIRRGQGFPGRDQLHGKYGVRGPLVRHPSLEKKVPSNVFRTGSLHVADEPDGSRVCLVDNVIRDGGDGTHGNMTPNRIETKLAKRILPGKHGEVQEEKLLAFSPERKTPNTFSANGPKANVGKPVLEFHNTRLTTPYTDHTTPYQHRQVYGQDEMTLADDDISYGADLDRDKKPSRPSDIAFTERTTTCDDGGFHKQIHKPGGETLTVGQRYTVPMAAPVKQEDGLNKPALSYDGSTDYVITKTSYKVPLDSEAALTGIGPSYEAVSSYRELPGEVSEATLKDTRSPHEAVSGYRELPAEVTEATRKDFRPTHDAVSRDKELPGEVSEATLKDIKSPHEAVDGYRELPWGVSEARQKDFRPTHDAMSRNKELSGLVSEATHKDIRSPHDAVTGYRELPEERDITIKQIDEEGQLGRVTLSDEKAVVEPSYRKYIDNGMVYEDVRYRYIHSPAQETLSPVEHQQVPERLSTQVIKQITRPTDQALLFKMPSVDLPSGHSYIPGRNVVTMNNQDQRTDIVVGGTDRLMHRPIHATFGTERTHDAENQVHEENAVTSRNVDRSEPVQERYDHPDQAVTDNILEQDARNEYIYVQGPRRVMLDPGNQEQPERPATNGHKYTHEPNLVPRGNQYRQKRIVELTVGKKIDDAKTPGVDDDRSHDVENNQKTIDKVSIVTTSRNVVPSKPVQGPDDQAVTVNGMPHDIHFQGHSQAMINPGRQEQLNREKEIQGPCDLQLAVERPDNDLVIEYRQLPGHKQVPTIQADRGKHLERVASLDRNQTKGQRRVSFSDDRVALKSTETPASIVQDRDAHKYPEAVHHLIKPEIQHISPSEEDYPRTLVKEDVRDINQQLHTDDRCTTTDITYKSIPRDLSHEHLKTTKEYPVISSTIAPSTKHLVSPAGEQVYIEETPLARLQQQYRSSSNIIIQKNDFSANEAPSPVSEGVIQPSNLNRNTEISFGRLPSDLTASFIEMSILYIDHMETFLENTQRAFISEGRYTFGSVKLPLIEIDEAINGPGTTVTQLVPVEEESAQEESKLCRHSPPKVTDIHNNPDENVNGIRSSEWSNQTAIVPSADRIQSQGCNDGGVSTSDESTLQGPLICRANTHPNAQVVDEGPQSSEWSNTVASAPSPGHVDSEHNDDLRMPIYEETSLQIRTRNNTDGVDTSLSSSDSSPAHVNSPRHGDGKMPIYEETSLQIKTCSNTDDVDTSLPSSEWASQTSTAPSAGHMNSQPCGYGGMPVCKETSPRYSKTRDEGNKTSQSSDWSDKSVNDPSAGLMMFPYYGTGGMSTNDGSEQQRIVFDSPSDKTRGNAHDVIIPVNTRVLHSRRPYHWHRMPVEMRQGDGSLPCHVCQSLLPLLDRINCQLRELESQEPLPNEDGGLQRDMDRVFESLYAAIDQREEELLASFGDHSPHSGSGDTDLASLLAHLENTKSYCDKTLVYTTKPELLSLTGMIHTRAEELLSQDIADPVPPSDVMFRDDGLPDLVQEIENFGKVFNEKDVDAAVKDKTFPKEHKLSESDIILEQRRSSLQSMPPMRRASMPPEDGRDFNSMPQNTMLDPNTQSVPPRRGSRDVDFNGYTGGKDVEGLPPHDPYRRDGLNGPDRRGQGGYPYQQNNPLQSPDDRRYDHRGNQYDPQSRVGGPIYPNPVDRRYEPSGNPYDPETRNADPMYQNPDDGRYDARGNPHGPQTRDTANGSPGKYPQGQMPHSRYPNNRNQPHKGPLDCDVITPDQTPQQRSAPDSYDEAPRLDPTEDRPAPDEAGMFPGSSALAVYVHAHHQKLRENDDDPATKDTMIYSITPEPDSDRDAVLSVSPKLFQPEHTIKCVYMEFDKGTVYEENHVTHDGKLVNDPPNLPSQSASWRFKNYKGALSTRPLDGTGMSYLEFWTDIEIKQIHGGRSLIFEAAVADRDVIDLHHKAEDQSHAWGVSLSNCPEHDGLCRRTWGAGQSLTHYPHTLPNQPDSKARLRFGFFIMQKQKKLVVIDCNEEKVLLTADNIKISRPLWPVFGVYNTDLSHVETALVSGTNLKMDKNIAWLILQNI